MTDKEIIKALGIHTNEKYNCAGCPYISYDDCLDKIVTDVLNLINRQQAEIKELNAEIDKQYKQAIVDIKGNLADGGVSCHWCIEQNKAEAIRDFAERLSNYKEYRYNENCDFVPYVRLSDIEKVEKEMVDADNE